MDFFQVKDERGQLIKWEISKPNDVKEVFWISNVPVGLTRGKHAHRKCSQTIILLKGKLEVILEDRNGTQTISMDAETTIVEIPLMTWSEQTFLEQGTEMVVLCSENYDEAEYIRDYLEFKRELLSG